MAEKMLEIYVRYTDDSGEILPDPERDDTVGRKITNRRAFDLMARPDVVAVTVRRRSNYAGGKRGSYR